MHRADTPSLPPSLFPFWQRYSLLVVISGIVLSNIFSLAFGHPALLDEAREHVSSEEEENHPLFIRMHTMASSMLFLLSLLQWSCFFLAAVIYPDDEGGSGGRQGGWGGREEREGGEGGREGFRWKATRRSSHGKKRGNPGDSK